jgi:nucleotide-binding universal stress UspA family protein
MRLQKILVAIDGSAPSSGALDFALRRAAAHASELDIAYALNRGAIAARACGPYGAIDPYPLVKAVEDEADAVLASASARAEQSGIAAAAVLLDGPATSGLLDYARDRELDAIVMGTHGRSGLSRLAFGSVAEGVLRGAGVPVFVVPENAEVTNALRTILVAVDGSEASIDAAAYALELASTEGAAAIFCAVVDPSVVRWSHADYGHDPEHFIADLSREAVKLLERMLEDAELCGVPARSLLRFGSAAGEILAASNENDADLIAIGTHGRTGLGRLFLGSVAESVIRASRVPVCALHPAPVEWRLRRPEKRAAEVPA